MCTKMAGVEFVAARSTQHPTHGHRGSSAHACHPRLITSLDLLVVLQRKIQLHRIAPPAAPFSSPSSSSSSSSSLRPSGGGNPSGGGGTSSSSPSCCSVSSAMTIRYVFGVMKNDDSNGKEIKLPYSMVEIKSSSLLQANCPMQMKEMEKRYWQSHHDVAGSNICRN